MNKNSAIATISKQRQQWLDEYHLQKSYAKDYINAADRIEALEAADNALAEVKALDLILDHIED